MEENHCKDCCCAQSWKALGITEYTGRSIPEHIASLRAENERLERRLKDYKLDAQRYLRRETDLIAARDRAEQAVKELRAKATGEAP